MELVWRAVSETGPKGAGLFAEYWPDYHALWPREGEHARPTYWEGLEALKTDMPELVPPYKGPCEFAGGGDYAARFVVPLPAALLLGLQPGDLAGRGAAARP